MIDDRGPLDLTYQIEEKDKKIKNLQGLNDIHRENNGDLRVENKKLERANIELKNDNLRLAKEIDRLNEYVQEMELEQRKLPFIIKRTLDTLNEFWKLEDMIY